jgi:hypothetical protein
MLEHIIMSRYALRLLVAALIIAASSAAHAQVPAHPPGSICATPTFWCYAQIWGEVGTLCYCGTEGGAVPGTYV